ncbi:MAG: FliA/WhiG family RNA polymerase sigma factor [candidate division Zixibacteria bacterium]|nr:FliA/WhiG family RNA polymerase sigma factor [candidate division Zixibacteria bacterium]
MVSATKTRPKKTSQKFDRTTAETAVHGKNYTRTNKWKVSPREWSMYHRYQTPELRKQLLNKYIPLVRNVATRMAMGFPSSVDVDDLINTGMIGLIEAFKNFDPDRGVKFETYAVPRIRGAILDELRALDWIPRSTRSKSREIDKAITVLENKFGRLPKKHELAKYMKITERELYLAIDDVSGTQVLSLDEIIYREDDNRQVPRIEMVINKDIHSVLGEIEDSEIKGFLSVAIDRLTEQESMVIALYYYEELTLREIGEVMHISESRVSQIHTRAVIKLRGMANDKFSRTG